MSSNGLMSFTLVISLYFIKNILSPFKNFQRKDTNSNFNLVTSKLMVSSNM